MQSKPLFTTIKKLRIFLFLIAFLFLTPLVCIGQISVPKWVDDLGGPGSSSSVPAAVKVDKQNNVYVTGIFQGTVDFDPSAGVYNLTSVSGSFDTYVAKFTSAGKLIWAVGFGGDGTDQVNSLAIDDNGNPSVTGQYDSQSMDVDPGSGTTTLQNNGDKDCFIVKFDTNGKFLWGKSIGGSDTDYGDRVNSDHVGNTIAMLQYQSTINVEGRTFTSAGTFNGLMIKYGPSGNIIWAINWSDTGDSEGRYLAVDANNNVIVTGAFGNTVNFNPLGSAVNLNGNGGSIFIGKYTSDGKLLWVKQVAGLAVNNNLNACVDSKGNVFIDGPFSSTLTFNGNQSVNPVSSQDIFIAKYNSNGVFQVVKDVGAAGSTIYNYGIVASSKDDIYISGYFSGTVDFDPSPTSAALVSDHGQRDLFLSKYDDNINYKWAFSAGNASCDNTLGRNVDVDSNDDVLLVGSFCSTVNFDASKCTTYNLTAQSDIRDSFVAKYVQGKSTPTSQITAFSVPLQSSPAVIDQTKLQITITVPEGTNITALKPAIMASNGVTLSPKSGVAENFTSPITYTLSTACTSLNYTVNVVFTNAATAITTCAGASKLIAGDLVSPIPDSYQWQVLQNSIWVNAPGIINTKDYQTSSLLNNTAVNIIYSLRRQITTQGNISYDSFYDVTVQPAIAISNDTVTAPTITSFCVTGDPGIITGNTPSGGTGTYTYQWQSSVDNVTFTDIAGATAKDYDPPVTNVNIYYQRVATSGSCSAATISNVISILVSPAITNNTITPPAVTAFCTAGDPSIIIGSTPSGGTGTYTYQWQSSPDNVTFTAIGGANAKDYDPPVSSANIYYRRTVVSGGCTAPLVSNVVEITISSPSTNNSISYTITCTNPSDVAIIAGTVPVSGNSFTYQWQNSIDGATFTDIAGANSQNYSPQVFSNTFYYRRQVISGGCAVPSNIIKITTVSPIANNVITPSGLTEFCLNGDPGVITGTVPTGGDGNYTYQWQSSADNTGYSDIAGATSKDFDPPAATSNIYYRRMVLSNNCITPSVSNTIHISILQNITNNVITAPAVASFCSSGDPGIITGNVPSGGNGIFLYQWQSSVDNNTFTDITGATSQNFDPLVIMATTYYQRISSSAFCGTPLISNVVSIIISPSPATPSLLSSVVNVCPGNPATLAVSSPVAGITYNWYDSAVKTNHLFTGATYVTGPINVPATFYVEATNGACSSPSLASVRVNLNNAPASPQVLPPIAVCNGSSASVNISNPQIGTTYNWYTTATGGASIFTGTDFITPALSNNATYYAEAANSGGCPSARTLVSITVYALPQVTAQGTSICPGLTANVTAGSTDEGAVINWYASAASGSILFTGNNYITPVLNANTTYYAEAMNRSTGCVSATRSPALVQMIQPLAAPVVSVAETTTSSVTFKWDAVTGTTGYQVSIDNGQTFTDPSSGSNGLTHTISNLQALQSVTIVVRATGASSCQLSGSSTAVTGAAVSPQGDNIYVANAFTPNGDSKNDIVYVHSPNIKSLKFYIYDQWGELLYTSLSPDNGWDGTYKGTKEPVGVYVYFVEAIMNDGHTVKKKGTITLLR